MKNKVICLVALFVLSNMCQIAARDISQSEAADKARQFIAQTFPQSRAGQATSLEAIDLAQHLYAFNITGGGYVIMSGETAAEGIIGYSQTGSLDMNHIPMNMLATLQGYDKEIASYIKKQHTQTRNVINAPAYRKPIDPLVKVKWGQGSPYNMYCPSINGKHALTGCVPTAMAQLMAYYKWPQKGHGVLYLGRIIDGDVITDSLDLDTSAPIDWKNIRNTYDSGIIIQPEKEAVAMLMKMCGYACDAKYGLTATTASTVVMCKALNEFFYYNTRNINTYIFSGDYAALHNFIYKALSDQKPLICTILGAKITTPSHAIIVDGCDSNGFFHINWGWDGNYDGYFKMCSLKEVGYIFGAFSDLTLACPDYEMKGQDDSYKPFNSGFIGITDLFGTMNYSDRNSPDDKYVNFIEYYQTLISTDVGLKIAVSEKDNRYIFLYTHNELGVSRENETTHTRDLQTDVKFLVGEVRKMGLKNGRYKCYPVHKHQTSNNWMEFTITYTRSPRYVYLIVNDDDIVFTTPDVNNTKVTVQDRTICLHENCSNGETQVFNTYGLCIYSGHDDKIPVSSPGVYTVKIGASFCKTVIVK